MSELPMNKDPFTAYYDKLDPLPEIANMDDFDFTELKDAYKNIIDGMAIMNISSHGDIGNEIKDQFSELTKKKYDVDFAFKDRYVNGHNCPMYSASFSSIHDTKPLVIYSDKTIMYGDVSVTSEYYAEHESELYDYICAAVICSNLIVDRSLEFMKAAQDKAAQDNNKNN